MWLAPAWPPASAPLELAGPPASKPASLLRLSLLPMDLASTAPSSLAPSLLRLSLLAMDRAVVVSERTSALSREAAGHEPRWPRVSH